MDGEARSLEDFGARLPRPLAQLQAMRDRHGDVFTLRMVGGRELLVVGDPGLAKQVFHTPADVLRAGEANRRVLGRLLGDSSLIMLDGDRHMNHRRLLLPSFHGRSVENQVEEMRALAETHVGSWPTGEELAALPRMRALALEMVTHVLFAGGEARRLRRLRDALLRLLLPAGADHDKAPLPRSTIRQVEALIEREVAGRREDADHTGRDDVLSLLLGAQLEDGSSLSAAEVRDELMTLIVAGTDTTAASLAWALERLSRAPEALSHAVEDATDGVSPYVTAVIQETLRMRPVVPMSARLVRHAIRLGSRSVPPATPLAVSALLIHHRADLYPDPAVFRPERFIGRQPGTYTWIPFGGGVRRCLGASFALMEMRIVLSALLSQRVPHAVRAEPEAMFARANAIVPEQGARVILQPR